MERSGRASGTGRRSICAVPRPLAVGRIVRASVIRVKPLPGLAGNAEGDAADAGRAGVAGRVAIMDRGAPGPPALGREPAAAGSSAEPADQKSTAELFEIAARAHTKRLLAIARAVVGNRASPEDVVQQALVNLYQHRDRYDWHQPGGLLRRAVVNEALRILRQPRMARRTVELPGGGRGPDGGMIDGETVQRVRDAIAALPGPFPRGAGAVRVRADGVRADRRGIGGEHSAGEDLDPPGTEAGGADAEGLHGRRAAAAARGVSAVNGARLNRGT